MSANSKQILRLVPDTGIKFRGPFDNVITSHLLLSNPSENVVCFKVQTTAPKQYCVRPSNGIIKPKDVMNVAVILQPFKYNPQEASKHKFRIQALVVSEHFKIKDLDALFISTPSDAIVVFKLQCHFEMPDQAASWGSFVKREIGVKGGDPAPSSANVPQNPETEFSKLREENEGLILESRVKKLALTDSLGQAQNLPSESQIGDKGGDPALNKASAPSSANVPKNPGAELSELREENTCPEIRMEANSAQYLQYAIRVGDKKMAGDLARQTAKAKRLVNVTPVKNHNKKSNELIELKVTFMDADMDFRKIFKVPASLSIQDLKLHIAMNEKIEYDYQMVIVCSQIPSDTDCLYECDLVPREGQQEPYPIYVFVNNPS